MAEEHASLEARHDSPANITSSGHSTSRQSSPACRRDELQQFDEQGDQSGTEQPVTPAGLDPGNV
jgi:hypothetical protein